MRLDSSMLVFSLQFEVADIGALAERYLEGLTPRDERLEIQVESQIVPAVRARGYLLLQEFLVVCEWKSPRPRKHYCRNEEKRVAEATEQAHVAADTWQGIRVLEALPGVGPGIASAIVHWTAEKPCPIWDFRALESLGLKSVPWNRGNWTAYAEYCTRLAEHCGVTMRKMDRALWRWSKERAAKNACVGRRKDI